MSTSLLKLIRRRFLWLTLLLLVWLLCSGVAQAGGLSDRLAKFPDWRGKPAVMPAVGDLVYPAWMAGTWHLTTTLVDMAAPLAPDITTPGFEGNRTLLNQPIDCLVRFVPEGASRRRILPWLGASANIVADRAFNGLNLARAYLGVERVKAVKVDPRDPNHQVTLLKGDRQLESTVTQRATEATDASTFVSSEMFQQIFRGIDRPYINEVETTTAYQRLADDFAFQADQATAIYLSPGDPNYFKAMNTPVALYRYRLEFTPADGIDA